MAAAVMSPSSSPSGAPTTPTPSPAGAPTTPRSQADSAISTPYTPDFVFRCNQCVQLIPENSPVYMRNDFSFCSTTCRAKGVSHSYARLVEAQLVKAQHNHSSMQSLNSRSGSSLHSSGSRGEMEPAETKEGIFQSRIAAFGKRVLDHFLTRVGSNTWGDRMLRTYSSSRMWGQDLTRDSSFNVMFSYLPDVDEYLMRQDHRLKSPLGSEAGSMKQLLGAAGLSDAHLADAIVDADAMSSPSVAALSPGLIEHSP